MTELNNIFLDAYELSSDVERKAFLDMRCADDPALRARIEGMLAAAAQADQFFDEDGGNAAAETGTENPLAFRNPELEPGSMIGRFRLMEKLGEGGFGVVWMAEQLEPVRRKVALKIIKAGMDTREVVARFEQERQALAMMDHPNIAQVFEAGSTDLGRPYFVMELVRGVPVTRFCDEELLPVRDRLALFMEVCLAIQSAHGKGIIHRDIKPSNILAAMVDGKPVVKVIDFGIAKATAVPLTDKTLFTRLEQFMGTPAYMSPEQARGGSADIDTRSDIYSLGILLYELLTGSPPFDLKTLLSAGYHEIRRMICEEEPLKPSTRLAAISDAAGARLARARQSEPSRLRYFIRGDLDWIAMRALEKDRARRYDSASALAEDIRHFLADEPVSATPPETLRTLRKFCRRHRLALGTAAVIMVALIIALTPVTWMFFQQRTARQWAEAERVSVLETRLAIADQKLLVEENRRRLGTLPDVATLEERYRLISTIQSFFYRLGAWPGVWQPNLTEPELMELAGLFEGAPWVTGIALQYRENILQYRRNCGDLKILSMRYGDKHPKMIWIKSTLAEIRSNLMATTKEVHRMLGSVEANLSSSLDEARKKASLTPSIRQALEESEKRLKELEHQLTEHRSLSSSGAG